MQAIEFNAICKTNYLCVLGHRNIVTHFLRSYRVMARRKEEVSPSNLVALAKASKCSDASTGASAAGPLLEFFQRWPFLHGLLLHTLLASGNTL